MTNNEMRMLTCPTCDGKKQGFAFICGKNLKNHARHIPCSTCKGAGEITEAHQLAIHQGRTLSDLRIHSEPYLSSREAATILGFDGYGYSRLEHGDPELWAQHGERALNVLRAVKGKTE